MIKTGKTITKDNELLAAMERNYVVLYSDTVYENFLGHKLEHKTYKIGYRKLIRSQKLDDFKEEITDKLLKILYNNSKDNSLIVIRRFPEFYYDENLKSFICSFRLSTDNKDLEKDLTELYSSLP